MAVQEQVHGTVRGRTPRGELGGGGALGSAAAVFASRCSCCWASPGSSSSSPARTWVSSSSRGRRRDVRNSRCGSRSAPAADASCDRCSSRASSSTGIGAAAGIALAYWAAPALVHFASAGQRAVVLDLSPDLRVLAFTAAVSIAAGLLFASAPAIRASRAELSSHGTGDLGRTRHAGAEPGPGKALVIVQVALSVVSLVGAGLFVRTLQNLNRHERAIDTRARDRRAARAPRERPANARPRPDARPDLSRPVGPHRGPSGRAVGEPCAHVAARAEHAGFPVMLPRAARHCEGAKAPSCIRATSRPWVCRLSRAATSTRTTCGPTPRPRSWSTSRSCANSFRGASRWASDTA